MRRCTYAFVLPFFYSALFMPRAALRASTFYLTAPLQNVQQVAHHLLTTNNLERCAYFRRAHSRAAMPADCLDARLLPHALRPTNAPRGFYPPAPRYLACHYLRFAHGRCRCRTSRDAQRTTPAATCHLPAAALQRYHYTRSSSHTGFGRTLLIFYSDIDKCYSMLVLILRVHYFICVYSYYCCVDTDKCQCVSIIIALFLFILRLAIRWVPTALPRSLR